MESLPYDDIEQLMQVLHTTYSGDTHSVKRATATLTAMSQDITRFIEALTKIAAIEKHDEETARIKNAAFVNLSRLTLDLIKEDKLPLDNRNFVIRAVVRVMFSDCIPLKTKMTLQHFLIIMYSLDVGSEMKNEGLSLVKEHLLSNNFNNYASSFLLLQAIVNTAQIPQASVVSWFDELKEALVNVGSGLIGSIMGDIKAINGGSQENEKATSLYVGLRIFKLWVLTIHEFIKVLGQNNQKNNTTLTYLRVIVTQERIVQILGMSLVLNLVAEKQIKDCMFSTTGAIEIDSLLNSIKISVLKSFNKVLESMKDLTQVVNPANNHMFLCARNGVLTTTLTALIHFFRHENLNIEAALKDDDLSKLIMECLIFLTKMITYQDLYHLFTSCIKNLIVDVCFSLIRTTKADLDAFENDPEQFCLAAIDACGSHSHPTPKSQAAKFLEKLSIAIDGALSYITLITLCVIDYSMVLDKREEIANNYKDLNDHVNSLLIARTDPTIRVETCLFVLSILNGPISKRKDLIAMIENLLVTYQQFFFGKDTNPLIKSRVCLLISSYSQILFNDEKQKEQYALHLRFVLECSGQEGSSLAEQASSSLFAMFEREFLTPKLINYINDFLLVLSNYVLHAKSIKTFDTILEIVTSYEDEILKKPELLINLVDSLVKRGQQEFEITRRDPKAKKIILNKIWNIIRAIGGREEYIVPFQEKLENALIPMFKYLENNEDIDFDEDILNYVSSVTKITKKVSPIIWEIFKTFPKVFERSQGMLSHLFPPLNQIIVHGSNVINQDLTAINILVEMGIQALNPSHHTADEANSSEGAVLLQLVFQYIQPISVEQWEKIIRACLDRYQNAERDFLKARLGGVFLCAFLKNFELTQGIFLKLKILDEIMDIFLKEALVFEHHPYDRKLLVIGLSSFLPQPNSCPQITQRFPEIFDIVISFLKYVGHVEQNVAKKLPLFQIDSDEEEYKASNQNVLKNFLDNQAGGQTAIVGKLNNEEDEDDEDETPFVLGLTEANEILKNLETDLKQKDEFIIFKEAVIGMKEQKMDMLTELINALPDRKRDFLRDVLQSQRVPLSQEGRTQARKIVKAAGKKVAHVQPPNSQKSNFTNM